MSRLWIVRHAEAEYRATDDAERALTAAGRRQALAAGRWLGAQAAQPLQIVASPYRRARETAAALAQALALPVHESDRLVPEADPAALLDWLERQPGDTLIVSHQPLVSAAAGLLLAGRAAEGPPLGTCSIAVIDGDPLALACGRLTTLLHAPDLPAGPDTP